MLRVLLILFLVAYLFVLLVRTLVMPFFEGLKGDGASSSSRKKGSGRVEILYNPEKGSGRKRGGGDYVDYEEVKE